MSNSFTRTAFVIVMCLFVIACNKQGKAIDRPNYGNAVITAFTVDSLVFSVKLNGATLIDSLASPIASELKRFSFYDSVAHVQVFDKSNSNRSVIDTNIRVQIGFTNINIVQLSSNEKPFLAAPPAGSLPGAGYCKVNFVYTAPPGAPYLDSVTCVIRVDTSAAGGGTVTYSADTITLSRYGISEQYYTVKKNASGYRIRVYDPVTNKLINETSTESTRLYTDFNTVALRAFSAVFYVLQRVY